MMVISDVLQNVQQGRIDSDGIHFDTWLQPVSSKPFERGEARLIDSTPGPRARTVPSTS